MKISVTLTQYAALLDIYGPPQNVHSLINCSRTKNGQFILEGEPEDFDELLSVISEEIGEDFCSKSNAKSLLAVCKKIDPGSLDWIGM